MISLGIICAIGTALGMITGSIIYREGFRAGKNENFPQAGWKAK